MAIRVIFMSTPEFGIPSLEFLVNDPRFDVLAVVTQPDKPAGRGLKASAPPIKPAAQSMGITVLQPTSLRTRRAVAELEALKPDVIAVAAYGLWIPVEVFDLPPKRTLNLHPSALPLYRGAAPVMGAIWAGDPQVGLSVLFVEEEMDVGDLIAQTIVPLADDDTTGRVMARLAEIAAPFFADALVGWVSGEITPMPQDHSRASWIGRQEKALGCIDWSLSAQELERRCRAFTPWPTTYTFLAGRRLIVRRARAIMDLDTGAEPGTILRYNRDFVVATGSGSLRLEVVQLAGRRQLDIEAFARGQRHFVGARLG